MRIRMDIAYDGGDFYGWQRQKGQRTVQEELETAFATICGATIGVFGSGRTDQGVHARRQVAHADVPDTVRPDRLLKGLNAVLPADVRIVKLTRTREGFHAQFDAVRKEYRYFIWNSEILPPSERRTRAHIPGPLDINAMRKAAGVLRGKHDFAAFTANPNRKVESTIRELISLDVRKRGHLIEIRAVGRGFLYKMVRSLAGFLVRVGQGAEPVTAAAEILDSRTRTARVPTAQPQGLFLWNVFYREALRK
jgi:tRNA pseudouridine38-40 synthase